jgi:lactate dehydrogenase-like 2-hydroxyacid dehydrogenase
MTQRVALACQLPSEVLENFSEQFHLELIAGSGPGQRPSRHEILAALEGCDALVVAPPVQVDQPLLDGCPESVRAIGTYSVGHDHIDLVACRAKGMPVLYTPDVLTDAVAETAMLLMLGAARRVTESEALVRSGQWTGWTPTQLVGQGLTGKALGIFGMGRIGRGVAMLAKAFGMSIHTYDPRKKDNRNADIADVHEDLDVFLSTIDVLLLASPLNDATRYFLDKDKINRMKRSAIVVNVGRGDLIKDDDLIDALRNQRIFAAGLDVFSNEPKLDVRYLSLPNVFMLPHIGSSTIETRVMMGQALISGLQDLFAGREPVNRLA